MKFVEGERVGGFVWAFRTKVRDGVFRREGYTEGSRVPPVVRGPMFEARSSMFDVVVNNRAFLTSDDESVRSETNLKKWRQRHGGKGFN